ncbi:MAG: exodeoxyribonuclease VII small subunit [Coriobacteriia bacterium]|nr:exodeoxyribonuclease VII small subunit [Coriobacteriia bacterium]
MSLSDSSNFSEVSKRLGEILDEVKSKDTSLEKSLDLFDEAIVLGAQAVELVDQEALGEYESPSE